MSPSNANLVLCLCELRVQQLQKYSTVSHVLSLVYSGSLMCISGHHCPCPLLSTILKISRIRSLNTVLSGCLSLSEALRFT